MFDIFTKNKINLIFIIYLIISTIIIFIYTNNSTIRLNYIFKIYEDKIIENFNNSKLPIPNVYPNFESIKNRIGKTENFQIEFNKSISKYKKNNELNILDNPFLGLSRFGYVIFEIDADNDVDKIKLAKFIEIYLENYYNKNIYSYLVKERKIFFEERLKFINKFKNINIFLDRIIDVTENSINLEVSYLKEFFESAMPLNENYFDKKILDNYKKELSDLYKLLDHLKHENTFKDYNITIYSKDMCLVCIEAIDLAYTIKDDINILYHDHHYNEIDFYNKFKMKYYDFLIPQVIINDQIIGNYYQFKKWHTELTHPLKKSINKVQKFLSSKNTLNSMYNNLTKLYTSPNDYNKKINNFIDINKNIIKFSQVIEKNKYSYIKLSIFNFLVLLLIYLFINFLILQTKLMKKNKL